MLRLSLLLVLLFGHINVKADELEQAIAQLVVIGFWGTEINNQSLIVKELEQGLGGVIIFDKDPLTWGARKNIQDKTQLKNLIAQLNQYAFDKNLTICVDQEGGAVRRLHTRDGFNPLPSAAAIGEKDDLAFSKKVYNNLGKELNELTVNCVFAPVVDLAINDTNPVIYKYDRAYSANPEVVTRHAGAFVDAMRQHYVISILKHFPGHGSSKSDSHKGFVDVSDTWSEIELVPFQNLINQQRVDMVITAHIYNKNIDANYPATLSEKFNTDLLRDKMGFKGLLISDDMSMYAIVKNYDFKTSVEKALSSGVDIMLFANQNKDIVRLSKIINTVKTLIDEGKLSKQAILDKAQRVRDFKANFKTKPTQSDNK